MWIRQLLLTVTGLGAGVTVAGGLFSFIIGLGVISDLADRTHTGNKILLYEDAVALGGIVGNLISVYALNQAGRLSGVIWLLAVYGSLAGVFVGCWAMALAEILNVFPIFIRRLKITKYIAGLICAMALGRGVGGVIYFFLMH